VLTIPSTEITYGVWADVLPALAKEWKAKGIQKVWIYDSHTFGKRLKKLKQDVTAIGETEVHLKAASADCYLVKLN